MERKLKALLKNLPGIRVRGSKEKWIFGLCNDSRKSAPKNLFFAKRGKQSHGREFIKEAVQNGASAVVSSEYDPFLEDVTQIITSEVEKLEALIAARFYKDPSKKLELIGVTGTNGKTTVSYLVKALLGLKKSVGLIGTVECVFKGYQFPSTLTTSDILTNQRFLEQMVKVGCKAAVMEVTSHALDQNRVEGLYFDKAIFTNLEKEHLDYHKDMQAYGNCKKKLFHKLSSKGIAILNQEEPFSHEIAKETKARIYTYGLCQGADYCAKDLQFSFEGTCFSLVYKNKTFPIKTPFLGEFNVYNLLAAIATAHLSGISLAEIKEKIPTLAFPPGRMERIERKGIMVIIDFAHTAKALEKTLSTLSSLSVKRVFTVFGCGGDRDPFKREKMGGIAEKYSDYVIVANDNPRKEAPEKIAEAIEKGFSRREKKERILDRKEAIRRALFLAEKGDLVLIAGKGHEKMQILQNQTIPFDDKQVVLEILAEKEVALS